jgi:hypothetical protein
LAFNEGLDLSGWNHSYFVAQFTNLTAPETGTAARFHRNQSSRKLAEKRQNLRSPKLFAQNRSACAARSMHLKNVLRQI